MDVTNKEFINKLSKHELNKNIVIYSDEKNLMNYLINKFVSKDGFYRYQFNEYL